jgi:NTP pyrophosphatase (non-canonical NTP hydrolase)
MTVDFLKTVDFLQEELQEFYQVLRRSGDKRKRQMATERLRKVINQVEPLARGAGEAGKSLAMEQQWEYMRVVAHLGTTMTLGP